MSGILSPNPFQYVRQYAGAIDQDMVFATSVLRIAYLNSPIRYAGQMCTDLQDGYSYTLNAAMTSWKLVTGLPTIVIETFIDGQILTTGTSAIVTGLIGGSNIITCAAFVNVRIKITRGGLQIPSIIPPDNSSYFIKNLLDTFITLSTAAVTGEYIRIQSIN